MTAREHRARLADARWGTPSRRAWPSRRSSRRGRARRTIPRPGQGRRPSLGDRRAARAARRAGETRVGKGRALHRRRARGPGRRRDRRGAGRPGAPHAERSTGIGPSPATTPSARASRFRPRTSRATSPPASRSRSGPRPPPRTRSTSAPPSAPGTTAKRWTASAEPVRPAESERVCWKKAVGGTSSLSMRRPTVSRSTKPKACDGRLRPETPLVDLRQVCRAYFGRPERLGPPLHRPRRCRGRGHRRCRSSRRRPLGGGRGRERHRGQAGVRGRGPRPAREARRCPPHGGRITGARIGFRGRGDGLRGRAGAFHAVPRLERERVWPPPDRGRRRGFGDPPSARDARDAFASASRRVRRAFGRRTRHTPLPAHASCIRFPRSRVAGRTDGGPLSCSTPPFDLARPRGKVPRAPG